MWKVSNTLFVILCLSMVFLSCVNENLTSKELINPSVLSSEKSEKHILNKTMFLTPETLDETVDISNSLDLESELKKETVRSCLLYTSDAADE